MYFSFCFLSESIRSTLQLHPCSFTAESDSRCTGTTVSLCIHLLVDIWMADRISLLLWICINKLEWESISRIECGSFVMTISGVTELWGSSCFNFLRNSILISKTRLNLMSEIIPMKSVLYLIKLFRFNLPLS